MTLEHILSKIKSSGKEILLVAVSKEQSPEKIMPLYDKGIRDFGENRVQEALSKIEALPKDIHWHFIGKLQKNKVSKIVGRFHLIHSVDSIELASKISHESVRRGLVTSLLIEVNTSGEETKSGFTGEAFRSAFSDLQKMPGIEIKGLMTMAPLTVEEAVIRETFRNLRLLNEEYHLKELSMGMSHDFEIAIEEGATILRIGRALFK
jgi:pyridoxal phosphate enzyme (YggS family)